MADILFHPEAQAEYDNALAWYQSRSVQAASRFEVEMELLLQSIGASPDQFPEYDEEHRYASLRRFPYSILYHVQPGQVYVVAVAHTSRRPGYWRGREE